MNGVTISLGSIWSGMMGPSGSREGLMVLIEENENSGSSDRGVGGDLSRSKALARLGDWPILLISLPLPLSTFNPDTPTYVA